MKKGFLLLLLFSIQVTFAQLNGTYVIGEMPSDYTTISSAANDLSTNGVSGPVVFNIKDGTYNEQNIDIENITGASSVNTITFQSQSLDPNAVTVDGNNIFNVSSGARFVTFQYLRLYTYTAYSSPRRAFRINSSSVSNLTISNCIFNGGSSSVSTDYFNDGSSNRFRYSYIYLAPGATNINISNNVFSSNGAAICGPDNIYNQVDINNLAITNNTFSGSFVTPIYFKKVNNLIISNNDYSGNAKYRSVHAIALSGSIIMAENKIITTNQDYDYTIGSTYLSSSESDNADLLFTNNFVSSLGGLSVSGFTNIQILNNSFFTLKNQCLGISGNNNMQSYDVLNNVFQSDEETPNIKVFSSTDFNVLNLNNNAYSKERRVIHYINSDETYYDLTDWVTFSGEDTNSIVVRNVYVSNTDLHTPNAFLLDGTGISFSNVNQDIDNETRNSTNPDIGADEFDIDYNNYLDIEIVDIISPTTGTCDNLDAVLSIKNNCSTVITSFDIECAINNFRGNIANYNVTINPNETVQVPITNLTLINNTMYNKIEFFVSNPNNLLDNNYSNDHMSITDIFQLGTIDIAVENSDCIGSKNLIVPLIENTTLLWSTGETSNAITVDQPGTYSVVITDLEGCQVTNSITLN